MDPRTYERLKAVLARVLEVPEAERDRVLQELAESDSSLIREVDALLAAESVGTSWPDGPDGHDGHDGHEGHEGHEGPAGPTGSAGSAEAARSAGSAVRTGPEGPTGPAGSAGSEGPARSTGPKRPPGPATDPLRRALDADEMIGPYRVVQRIGEGGMGIVFLAEQQAPIRRRVALKIVKWGMDTEQVLLRFESERQALALMDHPAIAKVLDAGHTAHGRPYFVMEHVDGVPVTEFCDQRHLTIESRLAIFVQICAGVHHAHQKGVLHRDLKPSNILVEDADGGPRPRIIDFGVAKALTGRLAEQTLLTVAGVLIGTPEYMSPEQARLIDSDLDTRSDVYSLGVVLYELLTGELPHGAADLRRLSLDESLRVIREEDVDPPSDRFGVARAGGEQRASCRSADRVTLQRQIRNELDWIVGRTLAKDRNRRYDSPKELALDIARFLAHEPVQAGPPTRRYRLGKFVRRHRAPIGLLVAIFCSLLALTVGMTIQAQRVASARDIAVRERDRAEASHLFTLARTDELPTNQLAYSIASLAHRDQVQVREEVDRILSRVPMCSKFDSAPPERDAWNAGSVAISPDGRWAAVGWTRNGYVRLYPLPSGDPIELAGHDGWVYGVYFTKDSSRLISCAPDGIRAWSLPSGREEGYWKLERADILRFRVVEADSTVIVWSSAGGGHLDWHRWKFPDGPGESLGRWPSSSDPFASVGSTSVHPAGKWAVRVRGTDVLAVPVDDLGTSSAVYLRSASDSVVSSAFSEDGDLLATASVDGSIDVSRFGGSASPALGSPILLPVREVRSEGGMEVVGLGFSPDNRYVWIGTRQGMELFDLEQSVGSAPIRLQAHSRWWGFHAAFDAHSTWVLTTGTYGSVSSWSLARYYPTVLRPETAPSLCLFSPDGNWMAIACIGTIWRWPFEGNGATREELYAAPENEFSWVVMDATGRYVIACVGNSKLGNGTVLRADTHSGEVRTWNPYPSVTVVQADADGRFVAAPRDPVFGDAEVSLWSAETGKVLALGSTEPGGPFMEGVGFMSVGALLLREGPNLLVADPESGERHALESGVGTVRMARDREWILWADLDGIWWLGRPVASTGSDSTQRTRGGGSTSRTEGGAVPAGGGLWRIDSRTRIHYDGTGATSLAFDARTRRIAFGDDNEVVVRSVDDGSELRLYGHERSVFYVDFHPSGRWVASCSPWDGTVRIWDLDRAAPATATSAESPLVALQKETTARAVPDSGSVTGYVIEHVEFSGPPGW